MPRPRGTGLNVARRKLADGSIRETFYNRATGESLGHDRASAEARMREPRSGPLPGMGSTLGQLIADYLRTNAYKSRMPGTQALYRKYLDQLRNRFGTLKVRSLDARWIEALKLDLEDTPSKANHTLAVLRIVLGLGVKLGYCEQNVALRSGRLEEKPRTEIWTTEQINSFVETGRDSLKLAMMLLLYTAQRPSDVLAMTKGRISERDGRLYIALRQQKTQELLDVPVHSALAPLLRARMADTSGGLLLVASPRGLAWGRRNFNRTWDIARREANLPPLQRRDLRRTAVVLMAQAGLTTGQIASVTGHRIETTAAILNVYLPRRTEVALAGIEAWEKAGPAGPLSNVVTLAAERVHRGANKPQTAGKSKP